MIIECLLSTTNTDNSVNFAPIGVEFSGKKLKFNIYRGSDSHENMERTGKGVVNITDDILAIVQATVSDPVLSVFPTSPPGGFVYENTCRYAFFEIRTQRKSELLSSFHGHVVSEGRVRDCGGFNRARNLLLESAVASSRVGISYGAEEVLENLTSKRNLILKTGGEKELEAYHFLTAYLKSKFATLKRSE